jgi:hypothetical protein
MGRLTFGLTLPTDRLFLHDRNSRRVHLHIQQGNRLAGHDAQVQLQSFLDLGLFALSDIGSDGLRCALHRFGGHLQAGQNFHLLAAVIEGCLLAHQGVHAAHSGRKLRVLDIQFGIHRKLADAAWSAQIVRTRDTYRADDRQNGFGAEFLVLSVMATRTRQLALLGRRGLELQQCG